MADIFNQMLSQYIMRTKDERLNAVHEVMQQIALSGLYRGGFFKHAAFYGGTCLQIFHNLPRFSEDMDFSLLSPDRDFSLENYFDDIRKEFESLGRQVSISKKKKSNETQVESAFLKDDTEVFNLKFRTEKTVKIKIEIDRNPPENFDTESKLLLQPYSFRTRCYTLPDLFAGKMHALIFRKWGSRVKGRDWYDFEWYIKNGIKLNFDHFAQRVMQSENLSKEEVNLGYFKEQLRIRLTNTPIEQVKADVVRFLKSDQTELDIWDTEYFLELADMIQLK